MKVPDALLQSCRDLLKEAQLMPSTTLVFDGSCTKRWSMPSARSATCT